MNNSEILDHLQEQHPDILLADGFEAALLGTVERYSKTLECYSRDGCIQILMERDKMSREDAEEHFEFNVLGGYLGEHTPVFFSPFTVN